MKNSRRSIALFLVGVVGIIASTVQTQAQDWPQWRGSGRDGKAIGFTAPEKWPSAITPKWKQTVGTGDATPALVGDKLYVFTRQGDDEVLLCLDAASGKEVWKNKYAAQAVPRPASSHPGPRSSPAVADGKVITLGVGGVVSAVDAATGKELWRRDEFPKMVPQFFTSTSPLITLGTCIAHVGGREKAAVIAFDLATGNPKWKWTGEAPAYASPVLMTVEGTQQVVVQSEKSLVGLAVLDGKLLWQLPTPIQGRFYNAASPIVAGAKLFVTGQGSGTKAVEIRKEGAGFAVKELWTNAEVGTGYNTPVLKDGLLFGCSDRGNLFCLNAETGKTAWSDAARRDSFCALVDAGTVLIALPAKGAEMTVFKPTDKAFEEVAKLKIAETPVYAHPVLAGKRIYVKDAESLALLAVE
jgi:outer membrane protein assembly factor BamB